MDEVEVRGKVRGPAPLTRQSEEHRKLIARGVSNAEACRVVKVHRRTGTRWLYGRTVPMRDGSVREYPAVNDIALEPRPRSDRYLSEKEGEVIADGHRAEMSMRAIARELGRDVSTVSRELDRNRDDRGRYRPSAAQKMATARMARPRVRKVAEDRVLAAVVQGWLDTKWSPEQIHHSLLVCFPDDRSRQLSTETIYQALYAKCPVLQRDASACLRSGRHRRRPHRRSNRRRTNEVSGPNTKRTIHERPVEATDRQTAGHWEGDLVRHEALYYRVEVKDLRRCAVAAA